MMFSTATRRIICFTLGLMLVLIITRAKVLDMFYLYTLTSPYQLLKLVLAGFYDVAYAAGIGAIFVGGAFLLRSRPKALSILCRTFLGLAVLHVFFAVANVRLVQMLGVPFNFRWLYYSDMLENSESVKSVVENLSLKLLVYFLMLSTLSVGIGYMLEYYLAKLSRNGRYYRMLMFNMAGAFTFYLITAGYYVTTITRYSHSKLANPVVAFVKSMFVSFETGSNLFTVTLPESFEAFPVPGEAHQVNSLAPFQEKVRNVILFVLESVPAEYVSGYTDKFQATPVIDRHLSQSLVFSDVYAHSPSTNNTLVSLLGSIYPMISYKSISSEHPEIDWPAISSELKKNKYRTGFFHASDNRFKGMDKFLSYRQFDTIMDFRTIRCKKEVLDTEWEYLDGVDEECMINAFTNWLRKDTLQQPFFATLWTMQTHYPYFASDIEKNYGVKDPLLNRYLNALHHSDAMLGIVLDELKHRGLAESTLVVVVGDHGEAFGRHHQYGHASHIYEENIKVPLILINPLLFSGQKQSVIGGHVDICPTIMDILRLPSPKEWQGTSLFDTTRINRAYFFSPWSEYLFGYRTPEYKVIYNANENETMVFNLHKDPEEMNNLANQVPDFVELSHGRLARWVQYHTSVLNEKLSQPIRISHQPSISAQ